MRALACSALVVAIALAALWLLLTDPRAPISERTAPPPAGQPFLSASAESIEPEPIAPEPIAPEPIAPEPIAPETPTPPTPPTTADDRPLEINFAQLGSFDFEPPESENPPPDAYESQIPDALRALSGRRVRIEGFVMPLRVANRKVVQVLLSIGHFGCCFGAIPKMNQWIIVDMSEENAMKVAPMEAVTFTGILSVGGRLDPEGYLASIYQMQAESHEVTGLVHKQDKESKQ